MKLAVIKVSGRQFLVKKDDVLTLDKQSLEVGKKIKVEDVLLVVDGDKVDVGTPKVNGAVVTLEVLENKKGEKVEVYKFKAKARYRKHTGFRALQTVVKVLDIS